MAFDLDLWPSDLTINRDHLLIKDYLPTKFEASGTKRCWVIRCTRFWETDMTFDLDLWPTDLNINRDHLLIKDYIPIKFEVSGAEHSWVISCTRLRDTDIQTDRHQPTDMCNAICPSFFEGGHKNVGKTLDKGSFSRYSFFFINKVIWVLFLHGGNFCKEGNIVKSMKITPTQKFPLLQYTSILKHIYQTYPANKKAVQSYSHRPNI